jgi:hypothetical protein
MHILFILFLIGSSLVADTFFWEKRVTIATASDNPTIIEAANRLSHYLQPYTEPTVKLYSNKLKTQVILTTKSETITKTLNINHKLNQLRQDGFILKIDRHQITIVGENRRGLFYGLFALLERLGYRFLSKDFTYTPKQLKALKTGIYLENPHFFYREIFVAESDDWVFATACRLNGRLGHRTTRSYQPDPLPKGRNIFNQFLPHTLVKDDSLHCNGQLHFSNPLVRKIAATRISEKLSEIFFDKEDYIYLQHEDVNSYCRKDGSTTVQATTAFVKYTEYIANELRKSFPYAHFMLEAYQWSRTPPPSLSPLPQNLSVMFSTIEADFAKPLTQQPNRAILKDLKKWGTYSNDVIVWHYITNFSGYMQPYPTILSVAEDIRQLSKYDHITGIFLQGAYETEGSEFANLRIWVYAKLLWNPDQNPQQLIETFCDYYYAEASKYVLRYLHTLSHLVQKMDQSLMLKTPPNASYLSEREIDYLESILDEGEKHLSNPVFQKHLDEVYANLDYIRILNSTDPQKRAKSIRRFRKYLDTHQSITHYAEGSRIDALKTIMQIERTDPPAPKLAQDKKNGIDWIDFQAYTLRLCCAKLVQDNQASDKIAAKMRGEQDEWGFQLDLATNLPKGLWDLYARVKITLDKETTLLQKAMPALYFGIHPNIVKGALLVAQMPANSYKTFKVGTIDTRTTNAQYLWISPPENPMIKALYVDRIFAIRRR